MLVKRILHGYKAINKEISLEFQIKSIDSKCAVLFIAVQNLTSISRAQIKNSVQGNQLVTF